MRRFSCIVLFTAMILLILNVIGNWRTERIRRQLDEDNRSFWLDIQKQVTAWEAERRSGQLDDKTWKKMQPDIEWLEKTIQKHIH